MSFSVILLIILISLKSIFEVILFSSLIKLFIGLGLWNIIICLMVILLILILVVNMNLLVTVIKSEIY